MGQYLETNLSKDEKIIESVEIHNIAIILWAIIGIVGIVSIVLPILAIYFILQIRSMELGFTNKRLIGKIGIIGSNRLDAPLNKVDNISVNQGIGGKMFGYGTIIVASTASKFNFQYVKNPEMFRNKLMEQIERFDEERIKKQAEEMAKAMQK